MRGISGIRVMSIEALLWGFGGFCFVFLIFVIYFFPKTVSFLDVVNTDFLYGPELQLDLR